MSSSKAEQPKRLAEKLKQLRLQMELKQEEMFQSLKKELKGKAKIHYGYITRYESGSRVPSLLVLLAYSRVAGISLETLIDDEIDLPKQ